MIPGFAQLVVCAVVTVLVVQAIVTGLSFLRDPDDRWYAAAVSVSSAGGAYALLRLLL